MVIDLSDWPLVSRGNFYEDHVVGKTFNHHWGRTIDAADNVQFSTQNLAFNPNHFNRDHAIRAGHRDEVVNPMLVFSVVFGLSVEDLSEVGGAFLGARNVVFARDVYPGETLYASSVVVEAKDSASRPDFGIVTWHTRGFAADGAMVVEFDRTNLVLRRPAEANTRKVPSGFLDDFEIGARFRHSRSRTITDIDLNGLTLLVMNSADGHFSDEAMADTEFGERINFGGLTLSLTIGLATQDTTAQCVRERGLDAIAFRSPVKRGDSITALSEVLAVDDAGGVVTFQHYGINQRSEVVCEAKRTLEVRRRADAPAA
ncbi:MaoC family dehydratase [Nocardia sp. NPDC059228]|uniref:MaoC family dehydratase n=1 Tax=Nocardia sp. NPDC059228 TaxID=3346777 RepID=UPI0036CB095C